MCYGSKQEKSADKIYCVPAEDFSKYNYLIFCLQQAISAAL